MTTTSLRANSLNRLVCLNNFLLAFVVLTLVTCSLISNKTGPLINLDPNLAYMVKIGLFFVVAMAMFGGFYLPWKKLKGLSPGLPAEKKVDQYLKGKLLQVWLFSFAAITVSLFFLLTADNNILLIKAIIILFMTVYKPGKLKVGSDLSLNNQEYNDLFGKE